MKNLIKKAFLLLFIGTGFVSCSDDDKTPTGSSSEEIQLLAPVDGSYVLSANTAGDEVFVARWNSADFGFQAAVNYKLQLVKSTSEFASDSPSFDLGNFSSTSGSEFEKSITVREFNNLVLAAGGTIGASESFKIRVLGVVNNQLTSSEVQLSVTSQTGTVTVTAYNTFDEFDRLYVPGNYQGSSGYGNDWSPDNASVARLYSKGNDGKYEGFVWMDVDAPAFKFTPGPAWSGDKGDSENPNTFTTLAQPGNDIKPLDGAGTYFFSINWNNNTYTVSKRQVAIIGEATPNGWGTPTYLTFDENPASPYYQTYTIDLALTAGEFLIRLKDDWSEKMGTLSGNTENTSVTTPYKIKIGGGNMKVPTAGNYKVVLDVRNSANYNLRLIPN